MEIMDAIKGRRSVRSYLSDSVPRKDIESIIEAGSWAPSGSNMQNWRFIVVESASVKESMVKVVKECVGGVIEKIKSPKAQKEYLAYSNYYTFFASAPVVIGVVVKPYNSLARRIMDRYEIKYESSAGIQGPSAAIENMLLSAYSLGYGSCWMTGPLIAKEALEDVLGIKPPDEVMALIPLGRPAKAPAAQRRKKLAEILEYI